ncbi:MAG: glycosyltransferase [Patescibacteria group bacterium]
MLKKNAKSIINKRSHVLIATFSPWKNGVRLPINGNLEPMRDYFVPRVEKVVVIDQVYPGSDFVLPRVEVYKYGKFVSFLKSSFILTILSPLLWFSNTSGTHIVFKMRDYLSVIVEGLRTKKLFDLFIGFEAINALAGVFLRRLGRVKKVVYYVSDYSPKRYTFNWFNALYLWLDRKACMQSDVIWDVSKAMMPARIHAGLDSKKTAPVIHVPNALYPAQIDALPIGSIKKNTLVFLGTLGYENGPDIAVQATAIVAKKIPDIQLHIIGGNEANEAKLKGLAGELHIRKNVIFHGFIANREKISNIARTFQVALAPYKDIEGSARKYGDATKIRAYTAVGLPVITTSVPPLGKDIQKAGAGLIVKDTPDAFAQAIIKIITTPKLYQSLRTGSIHFAKENTWDNEYQKAIEAS